MKNLLLLVGESGSGKTTVANILQKKYHYKQLQSYTTRGKRHPKETGHTFITQQAFCGMDKQTICAYTYYNNNHYFATIQQINNNDIYIIDIRGIQYFKEHYKGDKKCITVYLKVPENVRQERMLTRKDGLDKALERIEVDKKEFEEAENICDFTIENNNSKITAAYLNYLLVKGEFDD